MKLRGRFARWLLALALGAGAAFCLAFTVAGQMRPEGRDVDDSAAQRWPTPSASGSDPVAGAGARPITETDLQRMVAQIRLGDPVRGERIYRRKELGCVMCHAIGGAGGRAGPDLTNLGTSAPLTEIVEAVVLPDKKIKDGYHSVLVTTRDELDWSGVYVRETRAELVLRDALNKELAIPKAQIVSQRIGGSIMPSGLVDFLTDQQRADLFRFLAELGKPGSFDGTRTTLARVWRMNCEAAFADERIGKAGLTGREWGTIYTTTAGDLLKDDLIAELASPHRQEPFLIGTRFQTARTGKLRLKLTGASRFEAWIDGVSVSSQPEIVHKLGAGRHVFVLKLRPNELPERFRLESSDATFLTE